jgi:cell wall-associated NlpC family hydrolase
MSSSASSIAGCLHTRYHDALETHGRGLTRAVLAQLDGSAASARNATASEAELIQAIVRACVDAERARLAAAYRWTLLDLRLAIDRGQREVALGGRAVLHAVATRILRNVRSLLGPHWQVRGEVRGLDALGEWCSLQAPLTPVWRECPALAQPSELATDLLVTDGPVQLLAHAADSRLVRGPDGTVGWITDPPLARGARPGNAGLRRGTRAWSTAARSFLGTPYKQGGTTRAGLDCSGLVQRLYREVYGVILPRHSRQQFERLRVRPWPCHAGEVVSIDGRADGTHHVGIAVLTRGIWSVIHASSTRARVVEDPLEPYRTARM